MKLYCYRNVHRSSEKDVWETVWVSEQTLRDQYYPAWLMNISKLNYTGTFIDKSFDVFLQEWMNENGAWELEDEEEEEAKEHCYFYDDGA